MPGKGKRFTAKAMLKTANAVLLMLALAVIACARQAAVLPLARGVEITLAPPQSYGQTLELNQRVTVEAAGQRHQFFARLNIDPQTMSLAMFGPFGEPLGAILWDGSNLHTQSYLGVVLPFEPAYILADIQLALWKPALPVAGLTLVESQGTRRYLRQEQVFYEIRYTGEQQANSTIEIHNLFRGYK